MLINSTINLIVYEFEYLNVFFCFVYTVFNYCFPGFLYIFISLLSMFSFVRLFASSIQFRSMFLLCFTVRMFCYIVVALMYYELVSHLRYILIYTFADLYLFINLCKINYLLSYQMLCIIRTLSVRKVKRDKQ